jgi:hypothetical protein
MKDHEIAWRLFDEGVGTAGIEKVEYGLAISGVIERLFWKKYKIDPVLKFYEGLAKDYGGKHFERLAWLKRIDLQKVTVRAHQLKMHRILGSH